MKLALALTPRTSVSALLAAALAGCAAAPDGNDAAPPSAQRPQIQEPLVDLRGTSWQLVNFQSSDDDIGTLVPPNREGYTLTLDADGTANLQLDCNRASSRWSADPVVGRSGSITFAPGAMTRAYCGDAAMDSRIAADLPNLRSWVIADGDLYLALVADGGIYRWTPAPAQ
ncbi:META domain-containing protein [Alteraurantiacibacter palmitatis]|uniref:META domain-containing protein n=1 Tax=Alteraurantiacibacter palmitatis TaxID=2054628 RepID=A0ABV7E582_9SPHN